MNTRRLEVLVVGATGSIGRHVVDEALKQGHAVRALIRNAHKAGELPKDAQVIIGDVTRPESLTSAVAAGDGQYHQLSE